MHPGHVRRRISRRRTVHPGWRVGRGERIRRWLSTHRLMQVSFRVVLQQRSDRNRIVAHLARVVFPDTGFPERALLTGVIGRIKEIV